MATMITRALTDKLNIKPKDTLNIVNRLNCRKYSAPFDSITETYVGQYIYMPLNKLNDMVGLLAFSF